MRPQIAARLRTFTYSLGRLLPVLALVVVAGKRW
jgi:hypothetical protein